MSHSVTSSSKAGKKHVLGSTFYFGNTMRHCFLFLFFFPINFSFVGNFKITGFIPNQNKTKCQNFPRTRNLIIWPVFLVIIHIFFQLNWMCCLMSMSSLNFYIASNGSLSTFWTEINCHSACLQLLVSKGTALPGMGGSLLPRECPQCLVRLPQHDTLSPQRRASALFSKHIEELDEMPCTTLPVLILLSDIIK